MRTVQCIVVWCASEHPIRRVVGLGFNDTSTLVGHFVSSPREREKRDRRDSGRGEKAGKKEEKE